MLEKKSDKTVPRASGIPFLSTTGAADITDMDGVIAKLQQIDSSINRYKEKAFIDMVRCRGLGAQ